MKNIVFLAAVLFSSLSHGFESQSGSSLDFGTDRSVIKQVVLKNNSDQKASLQASLSGPDSKYFLIVLNRCVNVTKQKSCAIAIQRTKSSAPGRDVSATLSAGDVSINLVGKFEAAPVLPTNLSISPVELLEPASNQKNILLPVSVINEGGSYPVPQVTVENALVVLNRCVGQLRPGKSCDVYLSVRHNPLENYNASLSINNPGSEKTRIIPVHGVAAPSLTYQVNGTSDYSVKASDLIACDGTLPSTRSVTSCLRVLDSASVDPSLCNDPLAMINVQSPAGSLPAVNVGLGQRIDSCLQGSKEKSQAFNCNANAFHNVANGTCDLITYTHAVTAYSANPVPNVCDGTGVSTRSINSCVRNDTGLPVSLSLCSGMDLNPSIAQSSPAGSLPAVTVGLGQRVDSCVAGSKTKTSVFNCNANAYHNTQAGTCDLITYQGSYGPFPTNTKNLSCSGSVTVNKPMTACTVVHTGQPASSLSLCTDQPAPLTYQSPAGNIDVQIDSNSYKTVSCPVGSDTQTLVANKCYSTDFIWDAGLGKCKENGWPKGADSNISVAANQTYTLKRSASNPAKLRVVNQSNQNVYDLIGSFVNEPGKDYTCLLDVDYLTIPSGSTLNVDAECAWLLMGVKSSASIDGTLSASNHTFGSSRGYSTKLPDGQGLLTGQTVSYTIYQSQGGRGNGANGILGGYPSYGNGGGGNAHLWTTYGGGGYTKKNFQGGNASEWASGTGALTSNAKTSIGAAGSDGGVTYAGSGGFRGAHGQGIYIKSKVSLTGAGAVSVAGTRGGDGANNLAVGASNNIYPVAGGGSGAGGSGGSIILSAPGSTPSVQMLFNGGSSGNHKIITPGGMYKDYYWTIAPDVERAQSGSTGTYQYIAP